MTLRNKRTAVIQFWTRVPTLEEIMRILDQMCVYVQRLSMLLILAFPQRHEVCSGSLISERGLVQASSQLGPSFKTVIGQDMTEIGAVTDLRSYLKGQETVRSPS
jgi:exocyst complex component 4